MFRIIHGTIPFDLTFHGPRAVLAGERLADRPDILDMIVDLIAGVMPEPDPVVPEVLAELLTVPVTAAGDSVGMPEPDPVVPEVLAELLTVPVTAAGDSVGEADTAPVRAAHIVPDCAILPITSGGHVISAERLQRAYAAGRAAFPVLELDQDIVPPTPPLRGMGLMPQNRIYVVLRGIDGEKGLFGRWSSMITPSGVTRLGASSLVMRSGELDLTCVYHGWPSMPEAQDYILGSGCQGTVPDRR
jgi:hypothetical protein